jgi:hypothetical protein
MGSPAGVTGPALAFGKLVLHDPAGWDAAFAVAQLALGLGILYRRTRRAALAASIGWALAVWWFGEGLGGVLSGAASPLTGAVVLYELLAVLAWPAPGAGGPVAAGSPLGRRGASLLWLLLWASSAFFLLQPANRSRFALHNALAGLATGEPGWLAAVDRAVAGAVGGHGPAISVALAAAFLGIGAGVLWPRTTRPAVVLAVAAALTIWLLGENAGGLLTGQATDPNSGPLLILLAVAYWPFRGARPAAVTPDTT